MRCRSPDSIRKVWCSDSLVTKSLGCVCAGMRPARARIGLRIPMARASLPPRSLSDLPQCDTVTY